MLDVRFLKYFQLIVLIILPSFLRQSSIEAQIDTIGEFSPEKINLALRRTADGLLRAMGDSTSRIPAIEQINEKVWRVRLDQPFKYDELPTLLQTSLELYEIRKPYQVAVRRCEDEIIDLGFHKQDVISNNAVPCQGREFPEGCHFIEITFINPVISKPFLEGKIGYLILIFGCIASLWFFGMRKLNTSIVNSDGEREWLEFGNSRLDVNGQTLICGGVQQNLTFRETKLLRLFALSPDLLLERDFILRQVWADEGVMVGRSIDVFVSRLRKKLSTDTSVGLVAVHGVGYRLETGK